MGFLIKFMKKINSINIYFQLLILFAVSIMGLFGLQEMLDYFEINILSTISNKLTIFLLLSLIITFARYIFYLWNVIIEKNNEKNSRDKNDDSIIEMLKHAQAHQRWAEIIKIGSALSDVLWFTSRKKVRIEIGRIIEVAANQIGDNKTLATTLIEDIGNTELGLGDPNSGIKHIKQGIRIAEDNNYPFVIVRGYRNLACCYAFKDDIQNCNLAIQKAFQIADTISDEAQKVEAYGATEYAKSKLLKHQRLYVEAIESLNKAIDYYNKLGILRPEMENKNKDRLVKVYREKGVIYLADRNVDEAKKSLFIGLKMAQETSNFENIVRCCILLAQIMIENDELSAVEGMLHLAQEYIDKIDTESVKRDLEKISTVYLMRKAMTN